MASVMPAATPGDTAAAPPGGRVLLQHLVRDERPFPFTLDRFRAYLARQYCEENVDFLVSVEQHRGAEDPLQTARAVSDEYLKPEAPKEVNVSAMARDEALDKVARAAEAADPQSLRTAFEEPEREVAKMLRSQFVVEKFVNEEAVNIPPETRKTRRVQAASCFALYAVTVAVLMVFGVSRWFRLFAAPFAGAGSGYLTTSVNGL
jgi:hypothetical protein